MKKSAAEYPSSRSAGTKSKPDAHFVRFTSQENARLHRITERRGGSIQAFLHDAAMKALDEAEGMRPSATLSSAAPTGYGLRQKLAELPAPSYNAPEPEPPVPQPAPQIAIYTGTQAGSSEIDRLAEFVAHGRAPASRDERLAIAVEVLALGAKNESEKMQLGRALDEKLAAIEGQKPRSMIDFVADFFR